MTILFLLLLLISIFLYVTVYENILQNSSEIKIKHVLLLLLKEMKLKEITPY